MPQSAAAERWHTCAKQAARCRSRLSWEQQQWVEAEAPPHMQLPTGTKAKINYSRDKATASARIQVRLPAQRCVLSCR
jgi:hypothetical protein